MSHAQSPPTLMSPPDTSSNWLQSDSTDTTGAKAGSAVIEPEVKVVRRTYNYRSQVALAIFMMCFAALALTSVDAFNPE